jgi:hypothetical protein
MKRQKQTFEIGKVRRVNPKYHSLESVRYKTKNLELKNLKLMMTMSPHDPVDPNFKRLIYVRYADDFVVLLIGSLSDAYAMCRKIKDFLYNKLELSLNLDKNSICNTKDGFDFLGAHISRKRQVLRKYNNIRRRYSRRLYVTAPIIQILEKLKTYKFIRQNHLGAILATCRKDLVNHAHCDIIRFFNKKIRGLLNFYSFAGNYPNLRKVVWLLQQSCALTLALKFKLKTMRRVMLKYGFSLTCPETGLCLYLEKNMKVKHDYKRNNFCSQDLDKILKGSTKKKQQWAGAYLRKQVPLCTYHHQELCKNKKAQFKA